MVAVSCIRDGRVRIVLAIYIDFMIKYYFMFMDMWKIGPPTLISKVYDSPKVEIELLAKLI